MRALNISVVVPVYAGREYFDKLYDEVLAVRQEWSEQSYPMQICELIFVDDGSSDGSEEVLGQLESHDWIKSYHNVSKLWSAYSNNSRHFLLHR